jgi:triacylglycerol lipase
MAILEPERAQAAASAPASAAPSAKSVRDPPHLTPEMTASAPTWRAAYSDRTCALMSAFSEMAYLPFEEGAEGQPVAGEARPERAGGRGQLAEALAAGGFELVEVFNKDDTQAYLAVRPDQFAVLAFRGTTDFTDWGTNLRALRTPLPSRPDILVHEGFLSAFQCCETAIQTAVDKVLSEHPIGLYITGHSLGGGLAQIASAVLERDTLAACYTFGSPRVGASGFDRLVKCPHYRVVNDWDIVPGVPFPSPWGYRHTGDPRLLTPGTRGQQALRRDRGSLPRFFTDLYALAVGLVSRKFLVIDDHMIWNYRTQLEAIADARAGGADRK